jgi:hypothetical protein
MKTCYNESMLFPKKMITYLYCKNKGFNIARYLNTDSSLFRLNKSFFYKSLLNVGTRSRRLWDLIDKWSISKIGDYDKILSERREFLERVEDQLSFLANKILDSQTFGKI